jgi:hypothetical protein
MLASTPHATESLNQYTAITQPGFLEIFGKAPTTQTVTVNTLASTCHESGSLL